MSLTDTITQEIKAAMKAKDKVKLEALRAIKKELIEANTAIPADQTISEDVEMKILQKMVKQRKDAANLYTEQNREDLAEKELQEAEVINAFLPEQITGEELNKVITKIVADLNASSMKDMGKVMGVASKQLSGKADGKEIADIVKKILA